MSGAADRVIVIGDVMTDVIVIPEGPLVRGSDRRAAISTRPPNPKMARGFRMRSFMQ